MKNNKCIPAIFGKAAFVSRLEGEREKKVLGILFRKERGGKEGSIFKLFGYITMILLVVASLTGCGQKGALYLPDDSGNRQVQINTHK